MHSYLQNGRDTLANSIANAATYSLTNILLMKSIFQRVFYNLSSLIPHLIVINNPPKAWRPSVQNFVH